jgi:hypothetical protein
MRGLKVQYRQSYLTLIALALGAPSRLASGRNSRKQKSHQDSDDGDHHHQFHEGECRTLVSVPTGKDCDNS